MSVIWQTSARTDGVRLVHNIVEENPFAARKIARELILAGDSLAFFHVGAVAVGFVERGSFSPCRLTSSSMKSTTPVRCRF